MYKIALIDTSFIMRNIAMQNLLDSEFMDERNYTLYILACFFCVNKIKCCEVEIITSLRRHCETARHYKVTTIYLSTLFNNRI